MARRLPRGAPPTPPARICGSEGLAGPTSQPDGAPRVTPVPAPRPGGRRGATGHDLLAQPGVHRLDRGRYASVRPKDGQTFIGAPGAVIDGQHANLYAFTGRATGVTIEHLTIQDFGTPGQNNNAGVVNHDAGHDWRVQHNTIRRNAGAGVFLGSGNVVAHNCLSTTGSTASASYEAEGVERRGPAAQRDRREQHRRLGAPAAGLRVHGRWQVLGDPRRPGRRQLDPRQPQRGPVGGHQQHGLPRPGQLHLGQRERRHHLRDQLQRGDRRATRSCATASSTARGTRASPRRRCTSRSPAATRGPEQTFGDTFEVAHNRFVDNWAAVMAWENADRFAGSPANTSTAPPRWSTRRSRPSPPAAIPTRSEREP